MAKGASREQWGSRIGVILAVAGSAVGLGNFLRFPGQAAQNGGGAFMLPYFISLLVLGIPLCWAEWTMGRYGGAMGFNSAPGIYGAVGRSRYARYFGAIALLLPLVIYMYYVLIEAWCLGYAINYITGDLTIDPQAVTQEAGGETLDAEETSGVTNIFLTAPRNKAELLVAQGMAQEEAEAQWAKESESAVVAANLGIVQVDVDVGARPEFSEQERISYAYGEYFDRFVGSKQDGALFKEKNFVWVVVLLGTFLFNFVLIYRGVSKGIETFCRFAMPLMVVLAIIVLIRVLTLGTPDPSQPDRNVWNGLGAMWNPTQEALWSGKTWLAASGQIFFSLSVGFGIIINYASYLRRNDDVALSGLTSSSMNEFFEVCLGGLITLPAAFIFLGAAATGYGTFGLGFVALPNVFGQMPGGQLFGFLWFFMLFIAAITSSVSMLQPVIAFLEEGFGLKRHASAAVLGLLTAIGCGFVLYFSKGLTALDTFDFWVGTLLIYILAMFQAFLYGWVFGIRRGEEEAHKGAHIRIPRFVQYMLKYVVPIYLILIFAFFCRDSLPSAETPTLEAPVVYAGALAKKELPGDLSQTLADSRIPLPDQAVVAVDGETDWTIYDGDDIPVMTIERVERSQVLEIEPNGGQPFQTGLANSSLMIAALDHGEISPRLAAELAARDVALPEEYQVEADSSGKGWKITSSGGDSIAALRPMKTNPQDVLAINKYTLGYAETVWRKPVVLGSVVFILVTLAFLLLLVHIAGVRWEKEGRFKNLDAREHA